MRRHSATKPSGLNTEPIVSGSPADKQPAHHYVELLVIHCHHAHPATARYDQDAARPAASEFITLIYKLTDLRMLKRG